MRKIAIIGGGGVRTPLLIHGLAQAQAKLNIGELVLFDIDSERLATIARLGTEVLRGFDSPFPISTRSNLENALDGADFVVNSVRVGGMSARARDERIAIDHGLAGQETTGPGGAAMALRTVPLAIEYARSMERVASQAWFINFTNPAGLITQALLNHTSVRAIGICDTPAELFHRISVALDEPFSDCEFDYAGLNHLGWVRRVRVRGDDVTEKILSNAELLRSLYSADLFDPALIQTLRLIPTEYLFFYYGHLRALRNQVHSGATRGAELEHMNRELFSRLHSADEDRNALAIYREYLMRRNASYMKLEGEAGSAFRDFEQQPDPFHMATGYHRIAVEVMTALVSDTPHLMVVNVLNNGAIPDLKADDVVEVPCRVDSSGAHPVEAGRLPDSVSGLVQSVKDYERNLIAAAVRNCSSLAQLALLENPLIGDWELAGELLAALSENDPKLLGYLR
jgi:6-phospho-beta-glucosidase